MGLSIYLDLKIDFYLYVKILFIESYLMTH